MFIDKARVSDDVLANNRLFKGSGGEIIGDVQVIYHGRKGDTVFTRTLRNHNDLLVTGAVFLTEKANNMRSKFLSSPLDVDVGVHTIDQVDRTDTTVPLELISGIMVGNGGAGDTYNTVHPVNRAARSVPGMIPFRVVPVDDDLTESDRVKYFLRVVRGDYVYYYGKKFDIAREILVMYEDGTAVPLDVDTTIPTKFIKTYTRFKATVDARDIREYFKITEGSTLKSLVNSVGLITGYQGEGSDGYEEFFNVRGMTTLNMENQELKDSESTIDFIYRLFIQ